MPEGQNIKITFVYLAQSHSTIKRDLLFNKDGKYDPQNDEKTINSVTKYHEHIHVAHGSPKLPLPPNVEVVILLRAGIQALLGEDGYATLVDPPTEPQQLTLQEKQRT